MNVEIGDIFLTKSGSLLGRLIRRLSTGRGEEPTQVNHVGIFASSSHIENALIVEALKRVMFRPFVDGYFGKDIEVAIFRMKALQAEDRFKIYETGLKYVGRKYGYVKILAHALDRLLFGKYIFRRIARMDRYPICSWLVAQAYLSIGVSFGVRVGQAEPDDIWDYIGLHPEMFEQVSELRKW